MKERQVNAMLIIKNCNLINMAGIYKEKKDLVVKDGKVLDICDDACQKYGQGNVIIDACGNYVTPVSSSPTAPLASKKRSSGLRATTPTRPPIPLYPRCGPWTPSIPGTRALKWLWPEA